MSKIKYYSKKEAGEIIKELKSRFEEGEHISVRQVTEDYFKVKTVEHQLYALKKVRNWLGYITRGYNREGRMFGRLNGKGEYGFIETESQARFLGFRSYALMKGHIATAGRIIMNGVNQKLIKTSAENFLVNKPLLK